MNTYVWLATEEHLCPSAQRPTIVTRNRLSRPAAGDLAGVFTAGLASAAFFLVALITLSEPPTAAAIVPAAPSPATAACPEPLRVAVIPNPAAGRDPGEAVAEFAPHVTAFGAGSIRKIANKAAVEDRSIGSWRWRRAGVTVPRAGSAREGKEDDASQLVGLAEASP